MTDQANPSAVALLAGVGADATVHAGHPGPRNYLLSHLSRRYQTTW